MSIPRITNRHKVMQAPISQLVDAITENNPNFIDSLAKELMLDELLCGECCPKEFLKECMKKVVVDSQITYHKARLKELGEE